MGASARKEVQRRRTEHRANQQWLQLYHYCTDCERAIDWKEGLEARLSLCLTLVGSYHRP